jgi:hypothetical protein
MEASQDDSKTFHKLLRMQRSNSAINTDTLVIDNVEYNPNNIMEAWRIHFENLEIQCAFLAFLDAWSMLRFHIPLPTDLSL